MAILMVSVEVSLFYDAVKYEANFIIFTVVIRHDLTAHIKAAT